MYDRDGPYVEIGSGASGEKRVKGLFPLSFGIDDPRFAVRRC